MFSSVNLTPNLVTFKDGIGIKDKKLCILWVFTEKSDFQGWFTNKNNTQG